MNRSWLDTLFGIDVRSLAALRVGLGLLVLFDSCIRLCDIEAMYAGDGLMSIEASRNMLANSWCWSLHYLSGSPEYQATLLALAGAAGAALVLGWHTWWATLACWTLLVSVHVRAPLTPNGGDMLLRTMLFWSLFAPLGKVWSLDARRSVKAATAGRVVSCGTAALMLQLMLMYFFTGLFKSNEEWFTGNGLAHALLLDCYLRPLGQYLLNFPVLLKGLSWATLGMELAVPLVVWCPWQTSRLRMAALLAFFGLHLGIQFSLTVGLFSMVSMVAWMVFLPSEFWESRALRWLAGKFTRAAPPGQPKPGTAVATPALSWRSTHTIWQATCAVCLTYTVCSNIASLYPAGDDVLPWIVQRLGEVTNLEQRWNMFGRVPKSYGWYTARARLRDGELVDVLRGGAAYDETKPRLVSAVSPNQHWRYFFQNIAQPVNSRFRQGAAEHLFRAWNRKHEPERQIVVLDLIFFQESTEQERGPATSVREQWARVGDSDDGNLDEALRALHNGQDFLP